MLMPVTEQRESSLPGCRRVAERVLRRQQQRSTAAAAVARMWRMRGLMGCTAAGGWTELLS